MSEKAKVIRAAIGANPDLGNTDLAGLINKSEERQKDKIKVTAQDVGNQRSALKSLTTQKAKTDGVGAMPSAAARKGAPRKCI